MKKLSLKKYSFSIQKLHASIVLLCFFAIANAQKFEPAKVTVNDLTEKFYAADTTAVAAILHHTAKTRFVYDDKKGFSAVHEYELRIKIYKKEGLSWGTFQVPYFVGYEMLTDDRVYFSDGVTYNLENGAVIKTKLTSEGSFKSDVNEFWNVASVTMPNVRVGSILEFKYTFKSQDLVEFPEFHFQYPIPVKYTEYKTEIPEYYIYKPILNGLIDIKTASSIANGYQNFADQYNRTVNLSFQQINTLYSGENVPALKQEPYIDNLQNYRSTISHELSYTRYPDAPVKNYADTWDGVAKSIFKDKRFGKELAERLYFEQDLAPVIKSLKSDLEKANAILEFVKTGMNWNGKYGYYSEKGTKKAYSDKTGNVADINFILISMLNHAGINANPVLISTLQHGIPVFPNRTVFNYVIAACTIDGKQLLLDATDKHSTLNILPLKALNWMGRLIRQDGTSQEINLVPEIASREVVHLLAVISSDGTISGKSRIQRTDYEAYKARNEFSVAKTADYIENLENSYNEIAISDYVADNIKDFSKPVTETFSYVTDNHSEIIAGKIFLNPMLFFTPTSNPFVSETRKLPIYFGYPKHEKYNINIEIPAGFTIESMPKNITIAAQENVCVYTFNILHSGNKIQLVVNKEINLAIMSAASYESIKEFFKKMTESLAEKIVLKKM